jgi:hypothetical protein
MNIGEKKAVTFFLTTKLELRCRLRPAERYALSAKAGGQFDWRRRKTSGVMHVDAPRRLSHSITPNELSLGFSKRRAAFSGRQAAA